MGPVRTVALEGPVPEPPGCLEMRDEDLCCGKTEAVMSGLDGNCRSPRAGRKKTGKSLNLSLSLSLFFLKKSFMKKSGLCLAFYQPVCCLFFRFNICSCQCFCLHFLLCPSSWRNIYS